MTAAALHPNLAVVASWLLAVAATPALVGCSDGGEGTEPPAGCEPPPSTDAAVPFVDATAELGIDAEWHGESFCTLQEQAGSGTCVFDFDGDGDADIFFPDRGGYPNKLYRNDGDGFVDVAAATGVALTADESAGCLPFDYDADGDLDLFVANAGYDRLLRNDAGTFVDVSQEAGLPDNDKFSLWAAAGDIDLDGDLDLFVGRIADLATCPTDDCVAIPSECAAEPNSMLENRGDGTFVDVTIERGMDHADYSNAGVFYDFDFDGDLDLYVGNDVGLVSPDRFYVNDGTGHFDERGAEIGLAAMGVSNMGADIGDYDEDGVVDLLLSDFDTVPARLISCPPDGECDVLPLADSLSYIKWGVGFVDFDHDRDLDVFVANGGLELFSGEAELDNPNWLFHQDDDGLFELYEPTDAGDALSQARISRGLSFGDLDGDLDIDVVVANINGKHQVLLNQQSAGHALMVSLDTLASGAQVRVVADGRQLTEHVRLGAMYSGSRDPRVHFGLGDQCRADVVVTYPGGEIQEFPDVPSNQVFDLSRR